MAPDGRIVITGLGVISSIGIGREPFWDALFAGQSGVGPITLFPDQPAARGGEVRAFDPAAILGRQGLRLLDRTTRLALAASVLALADAGAGEQVAGDAIGVALGTLAGSATSRGEFCEQAMRDGIRGVNPALFPNTVINSPASQVGIRLGARAFNATLAGGATAALEALDYGAGMLRLGRARLVLAGGAEELSRWTDEGLHALGRLALGEAPGAAAPFDRRRRGVLPGEGAAMIVLEPLEDARRRGATIYAEYLGGASATDLRCADRAPRPACVARAVGEAMARARVRPEDIAYVAVGAGGARGGDRAEAQGLARGMAADGSGVRVSAIKGQLGETLSAGGALQAAAAVGSLVRGAMPPTLGCEDLDPRCPVRCARDAEPREIGGVLVSACSSTGQAAAAVIGRQPV